MRSNHILATTILISGLVIATPAVGQTLLNNLVNRVLKPTGAAAASITQPGNVASITPAQTTGIDRLLAAPLQDQRIATDRREAAALIERIVATGSCAKNSAAWNPLSRQMLRPRSFGAGFGDIMFTPRKFFKYHEDGSCLDVVRLSDWRKPANNALTFKAYYVSPQSGEAANQEYTLQKDVGEGWLIQNIAHAS